MQQVKVLLVQLGANGDCLFATTIAKQIKEVDYIGCHLTWMIGQCYKSITQNNPYIDEIIEVPIKSIQDVYFYRKQIPILIEEAKKKVNYEYVFITDYTPDNYRNWFGTIHSSLLRSYPHPLKINPQPIIFLNSEEQIAVKEFCLKHSISDSTYNILFECSPQSAQSKMTIEIAKVITKELLKNKNNIKVILSSATTFSSEDDRIIDGSCITWRGNAELSKYCDLLVGCSSGISWLTISNWCKPIKTIQVIDPRYWNGKISASMKLDNLYFGIDNSNIIEMHNPKMYEVVDCIEEVIAGHFNNAQKKYDENVLNRFIHFKFLWKLPISFLRKFNIMLAFNLFTFRWIVDLYFFLKPSWFKPKKWYILLFLFKQR